MTPSGTESATFQPVAQRNVSINKQYYYYTHLLFQTFVDRTVRRIFQTKRLYSNEAVYLVTVSKESSQIKVIGPNDIRTYLELFTTKSFLKAISSYFNVTVVSEKNDIGGRRAYRIYSEI